MAVILKFFGLVVIVVCLIGAVLTALLWAGALGQALPSSRLGSALLGVASGGLVGVFSFCGGMAVGAVLYVGGRALQHMDRADTTGHARRRRDRFSRRALRAAPDAWAMAAPSAPVVGQAPSMRPPPAPPQSPAVELVVRQPGRPERVLPLGAQPVLLGRDGTCAIALEDDRASRRHLRIAPAAEGGWLAEDLASANGTWCAGTRITTRLLVPGDELRIGQTLVTFRAARVAQAPHGPPPPVRGALRGRRTSERRALPLPIGWIAAAAAGLIVALLLATGSEESLVPSNSEVRAQATQSPGSQPAARSPSVAGGVASPAARSRLKDDPARPASGAAAQDRDPARDSEQQHPPSRPGVDGAVGPGTEDRWFDPEELEVYHDPDAVPAPDVPSAPVAPAQPTPVPAADDPPQPPGPPVFAVEALGTMLEKRYVDEPYIWHDAAGRGWPMVQRKPDGAEVLLRVKLTVKELPEEILKANVLLIFERTGDARRVTYPIRGEFRSARSMKVGDTRQVRIPIRITQREIEEDGGTWTSKMKLEALTKMVRLRVLSVTYPDGGIRRLVEDTEDAR